MTPTNKVSLRAPITYALAFKARRPLRVNSIRVRLVGDEVYSTGSGKTRRTHYVNFLTEEHRLAGDTIVQAGTFQREGRFVLSPERPSSVPSIIEYKLEVVVDIPRWPDRKVVQTLEVLPVVADSPGSSRLSA